MTIDLNVLLVLKNNFKVFKTGFDYCTALSVQWAIIPSVYKVCGLDDVQPFKYDLKFLAAIHNITGIYETYGRTSMRPSKEENN